MTTPAISAYLSGSNHDALREVVQVFRHDYVQYLGMILSWATLIEAEAAVPGADSVFTAAAAALQANAERAFTEASARLRPDIPADDEPARLIAFWEAFFDDFSASALPALAALEAQIEALISQPAFDALIENSLGAAAEGDSIAGLLLRPFERLRAMLQPAVFDARIAEIVASRRSSASPPAG